MTAATKLPVVTATSTTTAITRDHLPQRAKAIRPSLAATGSRSASSKCRSRRDCSPSSNHCIRICILQSASSACASSGILLSSLSFLHMHSTNRSLPFALSLLSTRIEGDGRGGGGHGSSISRGHIKLVMRTAEAHQGPPYSHRGSCPSSADPRRMRVNAPPLQVLDAGELHGRFWRPHQ